MMYAWSCTCTLCQPSGAARSFPPAALSCAPPRRAVCVKCERVRAHLSYKVCLNSKRHGIKKERAPAQKNLHDQWHTLWRLLNLIISSQIKMGRWAPRHAKCLLHFYHVSHRITRMHAMCRAATYQFTYSLGEESIFRMFFLGSVMLCAVSACVLFSFMLAHFDL